MEPEDLSGNLIVQLGSVTEDLNRRWYNSIRGRSLLTSSGGSDIRRCAGWRRPSTEGSRARGGLRIQVHAAMVVLGGGGCREVHAAAAAQYVGGGGKVGGALGDHRGRQVGGDHGSCRSTLSAPHRHRGAKFWRCVESGEAPRLFGVEPPKPRIEAIRIVDMSASNAWAEFAATFSRTRSAHLEHEQAKTELKGLMPEDAKEAIGHGIRAKRSKSGAVSFDVLSVEGGRA